MSDRAFGVEFEFNIPGFNYQRNSGYSGKLRELAQVLRDGGVNVAQDVTIGDIAHEWRIIEDGSEFEVKTPILRGKNGFEEMKNFLNVANDLGARCINEQDGTHVHFDAPEYVANYNLATCLLQSWYENQDEIMKLVHSCRINRPSCPMVTEDDILSDRTYNRCNLNIKSLDKHGTIEFRAHEGTLDYEEISSWINFGQCLLDSTSERFPVVQKYFTIEELMVGINVERNSARFLTLKKERLNGLS